MCMYSLKEMPQILKNLSSPYNVEMKKRIKGSLNGNTIYHALNDFFITKRDSVHILCLDIYVNGKFVT